MAVMSLIVALAGAAQGATFVCDPARGSAAIEKMDRVLMPTFDCVR
jgi:hypothetical protein